MYMKMLPAGRGGGASSFQFSTDEQKTNLKWIDGKDIYCKTVVKTSSFTAGGVIGYIPANVNFLGYDGFCIRTSGPSVSIPNSHTNTQYITSANYTSSDGAIKMDYGSSIVPAYVAVTVYYTK